MYTDILIRLLQTRQSHVTTFPHTFKSRKKKQQHQFKSAPEKEMSHSQVTRRPQTNKTTTAKQQQQKKKKHKNVSLVVHIHLKDWLLTRCIGYRHLQFEIKKHITYTLGIFQLLKRNKKKCACI